MSMSAFTEQLKELNPSLQITREANQRHMDYIAYTSPEAEKLGSASAPWRTAFHTFEENHIHPERFNRFTFQKSQRSQESPRAHDGTLLDCFRHARCRVASILL